MVRRVIASALKLRDQVDALSPNRSKASDGTWPSQQHHEQNPGSDHEPHEVPGVGDQIGTAVDITHDPKRGVDIGVIAEQIRLSRDPRLKYFIFRDRMFSSYATSKYPAWTWRPYSGTYHGDHGHLSTVDAKIADTSTPWRIQVLAADEKALIHRVNAIIDMAPENPYGDNLQKEPNKLALFLIDMAAQGKSTGASITTLTNQMARAATALEGLIQRMDALEAQGPAQSYTGEATVSLVVRPTDADQ